MPPLPPDLPLLLAKVRLGDVLTVDRGKAAENARVSGKSGGGGGERGAAQSARNRINQKHVDFLLCRPTDTRPMLVIELDDRTHDRPDRQERDRFLDAACKAAPPPPLPVLHIKCPSRDAQYDPPHLAKKMAEKLGV